MWTETPKNSVQDYEAWDPDPVLDDYHSLFRLVEFSGEGSYFLYFIYKTPTPNLYRCGVMRAGRDSRMGKGGLVSSRTVYLEDDPMSPSSSSPQDALIDALGGKQHASSRVLRALGIRINDLAVRISPKKLPSEIKTNRLGEILNVDLISDLGGNTLAVIETGSR